MSESDQSSDKANARHKKKMQKQKEAVDAHIAAADIERGVVILLTGDGKGKSSSAFGMVMRCLGFDLKVGVVQFIKGVQLSGEEIYLQKAHPEVEFYQMGTGFTWDTQDREKDIAAASLLWKKAEKMLSSPDYGLVVLDELTYMLNYNYLDAAVVSEMIRKRPKNQHVVITGRAASKSLMELADTVSEIQDTKHAFRQGIKAMPGIEW